MIIDTECSRCNGTGEVVASTPNRWSRFVGWDDLYPDDFTEPCPTCGGSGTIECDPENEIGDWMRDE